MSHLLDSILRMWERLYATNAQPPIMVNRVIFTRNDAKNDDTRWKASCTNAESQSTNGLGASPEAAAEDFARKLAAALEERMSGDRVAITGRG